MKQCGLLWKQASEAETAAYAKAAERDKLRYERELSEYDGPLRVPNKRRKKDPVCACLFHLFSEPIHTWRHDQSAPKRGTSAFLRWSQQMRPFLREKYPSLKNVEVSKLLGQMWAKIGPEEKAPFETAAREDYERYREELGKWKEGACSVTPSGYKYKYIFMFGCMTSSCGRNVLIWYF